MKYCPCYLILLLLAGCATFESNDDGLTWYKARPPLPYRWIQVPSVKPYCSLNTYVLACTQIGDKEARIYSRYSETEARRVYTSGISLWHHEVKHANGFDHVEMYSRNFFDKQP